MAKNFRGGCAEIARRFGERPVNFLHGCVERQHEEGQVVADESDANGKQTGVKRLSSIHETQGRRGVGQEAIFGQQQLPCVCADEQVGPERNHHERECECFPTRRQAGNPKRQRQAEQQTEHHGHRRQQQTAGNNDWIKRFPAKAAEAEDHTTQFFA